LGSASLAAGQAIPRNNNQSNESGGAASEKAQEAEGQIILRNPKKPNRNLSPLPQEPIQNPAKSLPQTNTAGQQPQDQQMKNAPKRWSLMKRAVAVVVAVVGLVTPKRRKGP
jgi:hypothetical protein